MNWQLPRFKNQLVNKNFKNKFIKGIYMKTKVVTSLIIFAVLIIIIAVLFNNKAKSKKAQISSEFITYPVNVVQAVKESVQEQLSLTGTINAYSDVTIMSETSGKVVEVDAEVGDYKSAGSVIIKVDDEIKKANYQLAEVNYDKAKKDLERFKKLASNNSVSDQQLEGAQLAYQSAEAQYIIAKRQFNDSKITTPISGVVTSRPVELGTMINNNMAIANVANISQLKVRINLSEADVFKVKVGDTVGVVTDVYPDHKFTGKIKYISDKCDDVHTYPVEIIINNDKKFPLKAGMFGRIYFNSRLNGTSITIPRDALVGSSRDAKVYIINNGIANLRDIEVGIEFGTKLQVIRGLNEGETVVVAGQTNLKDGYKVTITK
jgi:RND family efflux transporter MFP subunit